MPETTAPSVRGRVRVRAPSRTALGGRRRPARLAGLLAALALLPGCGLYVASQANPGVAGDAIRILSPPSRTQLTDLSAVTVEVALDGIEPSSLRALWVTGTNFADTRNVTGRFTVRHDGATATFGPADFAPGLTWLRVSGIPTGGGERIQRDAVWSWEPDLDVAAASRCEILGQSRCYLPFPSNRFTRDDPATDTGRRVDIPAGTLPANTSGTPIDVTEWNRNDGFSPGTPIIVHVPGVDLAVTGAAPITDIGRSLDPDAPIVLFDAATGERWPYFAELDATAGSDATRALIIRPARNFRSGQRIIVALRNLRRADGSVIPAARAFAVYRDFVPTFLPAVEARRAAMHDVLARLHGAGVDLRELYLAWDFTVASTRSITERALHMRDDALAELGGGAPEFTVTQVTDNVSSSIWRRVRGTFRAPRYLTGTGGPGSRLSYPAGAGPDALPTRNGTMDVPFVCNIPHSVATGGTGPVTPGRALVYGHGLLGSRDEVNGFGALADAARMVMCATDWIGMSGEDIPNIVTILGDLSHFPTLADRVQQGFVHQILLARLMRSPAGLVSHPAFRAGDEAMGVIATGEVFFNGNSQGGILGGAATALSTEWTRAVLGVPGMNYSTLLTRSVHWDTFGPLSRAAYPDDLDQTVGHAFIQMLWDRAEANGYVAHLTTDPLPGTPAHQVMLVEAFGDHQVANIATETEARSAPGMRVWRPALRDGRSPDVTQVWDVPGIDTLPWSGSVLVIWDYGTPAPPTSNTPPRQGTDPHGLGRTNPVLLEQIDRFLRGDGAFVDLCGGPCFVP